MTYCDQSEVGLGNSTWDHVGCKYEILLQCTGLYPPKCIKMYAANSCRSPNPVRSHKGYLRWKVLPEMESDRMI